MEKGEYIKFNLKEFLDGGKPCDLFARVQREMEVANYKEIYSKEYLLNSGLVTKEEYDTIPASTSHADWCRKQRGIAKIMHQVVGAEVIR